MRSGLTSRGRQIPSGPLASGDQDAGRSLFVVAALPSRPRVGPSLITEAVLATPPIFQAGHLADVGYESCTAPCS